MSRVHFYIDGFNLYNGAVKPNNLQWLDLNAACERLAGEPVERILFCTALVSDTPQDTRRSVRQQLYLRILGSFQNIEIMLGQFRREPSGHEVRGCKESPPCYIRTWKQEEKGSDVNLAVRLVHDAHVGAFDRAIVMSGDSDLVEPVRLVSQVIGKTVEVINPRKRAESKELKAVATSYSGLDITRIKDCLLPNPFKLGDNNLVMPEKWGKKTILPTQHDARHGQCITCQAELCTRRYLTPEEDPK